MDKKDSINEDTILTSEGRRTNLAPKWRASKRFLTIVFFLALALISEFFMVSFFIGVGLKDACTFKILTVTISPLFHLLPLGVVLVLVSSWIYLTKQLAIRRYAKSPRKVSKILRRHPRRRKKRLNILRKTIGSIESFASKIVNFLIRSRGVSFVQQRLSFGRLAVESTVTILSIFVLSIVLFYVLVYPNLFKDFAVAFYSTNSAFRGFVFKTIQLLEWVAEATAPIVSAIDSSLRIIAPSFRNTFEGLVTFESQTLTWEDLLWRYVLCQNAGAWVSAIATLAYGKFSGKTYHISK